MLVDMKIILKKDQVVIFLLDKIFKIICFIYYNIGLILDIMYVNINNNGFDIRYDILY